MILYSLRGLILCQRGVGGMKHQLGLSWPGKGLETSSSAGEMGYHLRLRQPPPQEKVEEMRSSNRKEAKHPELARRNPPCLTNETKTTTSNMTNH